MTLAGIERYKPTQKPLRFGTVIWKELSGWVVTAPEGWTWYKVSVSWMGVGSAVPRVWTPTSKLIEPSEFTVKGPTAVPRGSDAV
jgi:hypothetical protein